MRGPILLTIVLLLVVGCNSPPPAKPVVVDDGPVRGVVNNIIAADNRCDLGAAVACYADDAAWLPPNEPILKGKEAIRKRYELLFKNYQPEMKVTCDEVVVGGDWAHVVGTVTGQIKPRDGGDVKSVNDAYIMILKRTNSGPWQISRLMWHGVGKKE